MATARHRHVATEWFDEPIDLDEFSRRYGRPRRTDAHVGMTVKVRDGRTVPVYQLVHRSTTAERVDALLDLDARGLARPERVVGVVRWERAS